jgi:hypothetical protein
LQLLKVTNELLQGWEYEESNETCCGKCVQVACVVKDELKKPDEKWMSPDNCTTYTCNSLGGELMVSSEQETCPSLEDCPEKNVYSKGCCKYCNITSAAQSKFLWSLQLVTIDWTLFCSKMWFGRNRA